MPASYEFVVHADASPARCFALISDAPSWTKWASFINHASWEREGTPPPGGVGAIRKEGRWPFYGREQVVVSDPPSHHAYTILSGQPVRGYQADVTFTPEGSGTLITWKGSFEPLVPGTGALLAGFYRRLLTRMAKGLAAYAAAHP
jgi:hypothetical protein